MCGACILRNTVAFTRTPILFFCLQTAKGVLGMKKTVGCFTQKQLDELAQQQNVSVYQPVHDITYEPWTAARVSDAVDRISSLTRGGASPADIRKTADLDEFASKYTVFFQKLTDCAFVADKANLMVIKRLVALRGMVEQGIVDETTAQAQSADLALKSLVARVGRS